jgi:hypothetical protein
MMYKKASCMTEATTSGRKRKPAGPFSAELPDQLPVQTASKDAENPMAESDFIG